ncbi:MAG: lipoprotein, partial [Gammaproteobacteria bacterium]
MNKILSLATLAVLVSACPA